MGTKTCGLTAAAPRLLSIVCGVAVSFAAGCAPAPRPVVRAETSKLDRGERQPLHPDAPLWGRLDPGPFGVGFEATLLADPTRRSPLDDTEPRPVVMLRWYPSSEPTGAQLERRDYTRPVDTGDRYEQHTLGTLAEVVFRRPGLPGADTRLLLDDEETRQLDALLDLPVPAYAGAPGSPGPHPAVIYHPGAGGGFEENAVLFEYLASHGYIVVSSAFSSDVSMDPSTEWTHFHDSFADIAFLWRQLAAREDVDPSKIALAGHSLGAQTIYAYALAYRGVAALISLDTTFENYPLDKRDEHENAVFYGEPGVLETPVLNIYATAEPDLTFVESLEASHRRLVRIEGMQHEDFTEHGGAMRSRVEAGDAAADVARRGYTSMCLEVLDFLDTTFKAAEERPPNPPATRVHLLPSSGSAHTLPQFIEALRGGPESMQAALETSCKSSVDTCRALLPRAVDDLAFGTDTATLARLADYLRQPENRTRLTSFDLERSLARVAMRNNDWATAKDDLQRALELLRKHPFDSDLYQQHFLGQTQELLDLATARAEKAR